MAALVLIAATDHMMAIIYEVLKTPATGPKDGDVDMIHIVAACHLLSCWSLVRLILRP
jgi:hypothetical protein